MTAAPDTVAAADINEADAFRGMAEACRPVIIRGWARDWPAVAAGRVSPEVLRNYLALLDNGGTAEAFIGDPAIAGCYSYAADLEGFNFTRESMTLAAALDRIVATAGVADAPTVYIGSLPTDAYLPWVRAAKSGGGAAGRSAAANLDRPWIGCRVSPRQSRQSCLRRRWAAPLHPVSARCDR